MIHCRECSFIAIAYLDAMAMNEHELSHRRSLNAESHQRQWAARDTARVSQRWSERPCEHRTAL